MSDVAPAKYLIVGHVNAAEVCRKVCLLMDKGYVPHGSLVFDPTEGGYLFQPMVLVAPSMAATNV